MKRFIARFGDRIIGILSGFDRLVFRGTLRNIAFVNGLKGLLWKQQVLLKDFGAYAEGVTEQLKEASLEEARRLDRPIQYLPSGGVRKEAIALKIADRDGIKEGLITILTSVESCNTFDIYRNRELKRLQLVSRVRKCLFLYHYMIDPVFGFMSARIQTWLPFSVQICINGREWLARQMDHAGIGYDRRDNSFARIDDLSKAQNLMEAQQRTDWPRTLNRIARQLNPAHGRIFKGYPLSYYWSAYQSEWATDLMFKDAGSLAQIYPSLILHGITTFSSTDVMRFLGQAPHGMFKKEVVTSFKDRTEGVRIKHIVGHNSVKLYDKQGSILRVETTIHNAKGMKVFRPKEGDPGGALAWRPLRSGIADLHRRAEVSQASNDRYLEALASVTTSTPLGQLVHDICRRTTWKGKRLRAMRPWDEGDLDLLRAINRGEFALNGFRNRDLQGLLYPSGADSTLETRRRSARVTRLLRLLRAHSLIRKVPSTHRYTVTEKGREIIAGILTAHQVTVDQLRKAAA